MKTLFETLETQGIRMTKTRRTILESFQNNDRPLSALELQSLLEQSSHSVNKTTVYRELEFLLKQNIIIPIFIDEHQKKYELVGGHHHHIVCRNCGDLQDVEMKEIETLFEKIEKKLLKNKKFKNVMHSLEFFGLCSRCALSAS